MPEGSNVKQTGSASSTSSNQVALGGVLINFSSTGASGSNGFSLISQNTSDTPCLVQLDKTTSGAGSQSSIITTTGGFEPVPSYSVGNIIILNEAVGSFDPRVASAFMGFFW
jgi:hypothetical protein